jgi:hypothetical protein
MQVEPSMTEAEDIKLKLMVVDDEADNLELLHRPFAATLKYSSQKAA